MTLDGFSHHSVLPHEDNGVAAERDADLLHLLRTHVVGAHYETFWILVQELLRTSVLINFSTYYSG